MTIKFDKEGREICDSTPLEIPIGMRQPENVDEMIRRLIAGEMSRQAAEAGDETLEEANDFDVESDEAELSLTGYEVTELQEETPWSNIDEAIAAHRKQADETAAKLAELEALRKKKGPDVPAPEASDAPES